MMYNDVKCSQAHSSPKLSNNKMKHDIYGLKMSKVEFGLRPGASWQDLHFESLHIRYHQIAKKKAQNGTNIMFYLFVST